MDIDLRDKVALVCGASQGIGAGIARAFAEQGATVIVMARRAEALQTVLASLATEHDQTHDLLVNEGDRSTLIQSLKQLLNKHKHIDILVNNSGGPAPGPIAEASESDFLQAFSDHLLVAHGLVQAVLPSMQTQGYGRILNITSTSVKTPLPNLGVSNVTRAAVASWAKTLANEITGDGITVNTLMPGFIETPRIENLASKTAERLTCTEAEVREQWLQSIPVGHFGQPQDMAAIASFLASPLGAYINGIVLAVDGGRTATI